MKESSSSDSGKSLDPEFSPSTSLQGFEFERFLSKAETGEEFWRAKSKAIGETLLIQSIPPELRYQKAAGEALQSAVQGFSDTKVNGAIVPANYHKSGGSVLVSYKDSSDLEGSLQSRLFAYEASGQGPAFSEVKRIAIAVGEVLREAHRKGVVHGALDEAQIFLTPAEAIQIAGFQTTAIMRGELAKISDVGFEVSQTAAVDVSRWARLFVRMLTGDRDAQQVPESDTNGAEIPKKLQSLLAGCLAAQLPEFSSFEKVLPVLEGRGMKAADGAENEEDRPSTKWLKKAAPFAAGIAAVAIVLVSLFAKVSPSAQEAEAQNEREDAVAQTSAGEVIDESPAGTESAEDEPTPETDEPTEPEADAGSGDSSLYAASLNRYQGNAGAAEVEYEALLKERPDDVGLLLAKGECLLGVDDAAAAVKAFDAAIQAQEKFFLSFNRRAVAYEALDNRGAAHKDRETGNALYNEQHLSEWLHLHEKVLAERTVVGDPPAEGEIPTKVKFITKEDGHVRIYYIGAGEGVYLLYPNAGAKSDRVSAGDEIEVEIPSVPQTDLPRTVTVLTDQPFADLDAAAAAQLSGKKMRHVTPFEIPYLGTLSPFGERQVWVEEINFETGESLIPTRPELRDEE